MTRARAAKRPPDPSGDDRAFPARRLRTRAHWYREHDQSDSPWFFSSGAAGRFNLDHLRGTCYLATSAPAAVRERVGPAFASSGSAPASLLAGRVVSRLTLPATVPAANLEGTAAAHYRVTRELAVMTAYQVPRAWARVFDAHGITGIVFGLRFSPGGPNGLALFGAAGNTASADPRWTLDPGPEPASAVARKIGIARVEIPAADRLRILRP
ncbi:MAG: RES domain-containing protein [Mycobacteriales bacterium]